MPLLDSITLVVKAKAICTGWPRAGWTVTDYPSEEECGETISCEIPVPDPGRGFDTDDLEYLASERIAELGWCAYSHPGGMRYAPQWYCPHHVARIRAERDALDPYRRGGQLKNNLWPPDESAGSSGADPEVASPVPAERRVSPERDGEHPVTGVNLGNSQSSAIQRGAQAAGSEVLDIDDEAREPLTEEQRAVERLRVQFPEYWFYWDTHERRFAAALWVRPDCATPRATRAATEAELAEKLTKRRPAHLKRWAKYLYTEDWQLTPLPETPLPDEWPHGKPPETREEGEEASQRLHAQYPDYEVCWRHERSGFLARYVGETPHAVTSTWIEAPTEKMIAETLKLASKGRRLYLRAAQPKA